MRALNRVIDQKRDNLIAAAHEATSHANANPGDKRAQEIANACGDAALAGRLISDEYRYNRRSY